MDSAADAISVPPAQPRLGINSVVVRQVLFGDGDLRKLKTGHLQYGYPRRNESPEGNAELCREGGGRRAMVDGPCRRVPT